MAQAAGAPRPGAGQPPLVFKLVLLGSGSVGKSSLALRYVKDDFRSTLPTVGCAFFTKVVDLGAAPVKLEIWDTAGQEKYHSVCHLYFRGANAALLVYDITSKESFHKAQQWLKDLEKESSPGEVVVMLVGNKADLGEEREVPLEPPLPLARGPRGAALGHEEGTSRFPGAAPAVRVSRSGVAGQQAGKETKRNPKQKWLTPPHGATECLKRKDIRSVSLGTL
ncbi:ras-related protein Rab-17 isoform X1 [Artibeus jamaicensis]|uniref:ras-related protein Rab-17 isoform X1 n=1 Tax=Artibeus jamaicensis TaxID=9417 RepID=UPI00235AE662|nr:ras-related protein Rab-17 isoform X1 [Artibeus jamaicensis]XP_053511202.1 ras-related protein Rab-17 isoform X1 [Artibeus jamaicensis]XP_053511203.1 ras-related protein Rab-17 isoform X1 [Artibeus jamaicensis]